MNRKEDGVSRSVGVCSTRCQKQVSSSLGFNQTRIL